MIITLIKNFKMNHNYTKYSKLYLIPINENIM